MRWLKRMVLSVEDKWPTRPPPTVPPSGPPTFHCRRCKVGTDNEAATCSACGADLRHQE